MPPSIDVRLKKCFDDTRSFRMTDYVPLNLKLAPEERILGVYFNREFDNYSDGFVISTKGLHLLSSSAARFIDYEDIATDALHPNKQDQGRELKYRYVELILKSGERIKVYVSGEYEKGGLELYDLARFLSYVHGDRRIESERQQKQQASINLHQTSF